MKKVLVLMLLLLWVVPMVWAAEPSPDRKVRKFGIRHSSSRVRSVRNEWCNLIAENWEKSWDSTWM